MSVKLVVSFLLVTVCLVATAQADIMVGDWQFNTPGDTQGWTSRSSWTLPEGVYVAQAVDGIETVLTSGDIGGNGDAGIQLPASELPIELPANASSWGTLTIRLRQLDGNPDEGGQPMAYAGGTLVIMTGVFQDNPIPSATNLNDDPPIIVDFQADQWVQFQWDLTSRSGTISGFRFDPVSNVDGNFEIDFITLTAVPEPTTLSLLSLGLLGLLRRRGFAA